MMRFGVSDGLSSEQLLVTVPGGSALRFDHFPTRLLT